MPCNNVKTDRYLKDLSPQGKRVENSWLVDVMPAFGCVREEI